MTATLKTSGGQLIKSSEYYAHWLVEFVDGQRITMFSETGEKRRFDQAIANRTDLLFAVWIPLNDRMPKLGIVYKDNKAYFILGTHIICPEIPGYLQSTIYIPKLFIRNKIVVKHTKLTSVGSIEYHCQVKYFHGDILKEVGVFWDGESFEKIGFYNLRHLGEAEIR